MVDDAGDASAKQRADDDAQCRIGSSVGVSSDGATDDAVTADKHIHVEVDIHLEGRQHDDVEEVSSSTLLLSAGVFIGRHFLVHGVGTQ